jgi:hypothetical protein
MAVGDNVAGVGAAESILATLGSDGYYVARIQNIGLERFATWPTDQ